MIHAPNARLCGFPRMMSDLFDFTNLARSRQVAVLLSTAQLKLS